MKTTLIFCLALGLGLQATAGLKLLDRIQNARNHKRQSYSLTEEQIIAGFKSQIKDYLDQAEAACPEEDEFPDCSAVDSDIDSLLDDIYNSPGDLDPIEEELESKAEEIRKTLHSEGLSREEVDCAFNSCLFINVFFRHINDSRIPACDLSSCGFKRGLDLRDLQRLHQNRRGDSDDDNDDDVDDDDDDGNDDGNDKDDDDKSAGSAEYGRTELDDLYALCFVENAYTYCMDVDTNDECAGIIADQIAVTLSNCFSQYNSNNQGDDNKHQGNNHANKNKGNNYDDNSNNVFKKKGIKEAIVDKLKRMVAEKEAKARRDQLLKRLLKELDF